MGSTRSAPAVCTAETSDAARSARADSRRDRKAALARTGWAAVACAVLVAAAEVPGRAQGEDFVPVTDAMLQDPDPADWLMWRRTLDGWGFR